MSFAKFPTSNDEGRKSGDGIDSLSTLLKQSIGREPFLSFPRSAESPVQLLQLLHSLDSAGWPLLPVNVPMQKCEKCNGEYYSPINFRRHMRIHHRLKKHDKDDLKNRDLLSLFWDKLSADEAKEIVSLKNTTYEGLPGATIVKELASITRKPGIPSLPHFCIKAGSALLDIVQTRPSRFPPSSQEFFGVLDDASERTLLCGSAISMQKYIFDGGEVATTGLDTKNLVAFTSFILERRLVEAWIADKDAEALRCQKLLVEEEEDAKRRQAEISERKRRKKLRQKKEHKVKEQKNEEEGGFSVEEAEPLTDTSVHINALDSESTDNLDQTSSPEIHNVENADSESHQAEMESVRDDDSNIQSRNEPRRINHYPRPFWQQNPSIVMNDWRGSSTWKHEHRNWQGPHTADKKVWRRKVKYENGESLKVVREPQETLLVQAEQDTRQEVLIGSIPVPLASSQVREDSDASVERGLSSNHALQKFVRDNASLKSGNGEARVVSLNDINYNSESCAEPPCADCHDSKIVSDSLTKESTFPFTGGAARAFLAQRWKEAIASDHVTLLLSPPNRPLLQPRARPDSSGRRSTLGVSVSRGTAGLMKKYIPKQKSGI